MSSGRLRRCLPRPALICKAVVLAVALLLSDAAGKNYPQCEECSESDCAKCCFHISVTSCSGLLSVVWPSYVSGILRGRIAHVTKRPGSKPGLLSWIP